MKVIYPGSFDPLTLSHLDIIKRASGISDEVIIAVLKNTNKKSFFSLSERVSMIEDEIGEYKNVKVKSFDGLLVNFVKSENCNVIIRGLRDVADFGYEMQMALVNNRLLPDIETLFLVSDSKYSFISSSLVREIALYGGDYSKFVPEKTYKKLKEKFEEDKNGND